MVVFFIVYQQIENHLLQPVIYGRTVQLSPLAVLISILIGAELAGILGRSARSRSRARSRCCSWTGSSQARARSPPPSSVESCFRTIKVRRRSLPKGEAWQRAAVCSASLAATLVVLVAPSAGSADAHRTMSSSNQLQTALLGQVNALRAANGLGRLRLCNGAQRGRRPPLDRDGAARLLQPRLGQQRLFSSRIEQFYPPGGFHSWTVGENLLWASPDVGALRALKLWLASPPHRANLLSPRWREIGLAAVHSTSAPGVYGGRPATVVTADFGARTR